MSYTIQDQYHKLTITLNTNLTTKTRDIILHVYKNNQNTPQTINPKTRTPNPDGTSTHIFEIPFKNYNIGDTITKIMAVMPDNRPITDLNEGITILVDGKETNVQKVNPNETTTAYADGKPILLNPLIGTNRFTLQFKDNNPHTIQAIYKGNEEIGVARSEKIVITPTQANEGIGKYKLTSNVPKKMKYMTMPNWKWKLTKNGVPQPKKLIQKVTPTEIRSTDTNRLGEVYLDTVALDRLAQWTVGTYTIAARFWHFQDIYGNYVVTECKNTLQIVKNTPTLTYTPSAGKGKKAVFKLRDPMKKAMVNQKLIITINGKNHTKTTDAKGNVSIKTNTKGRFKGKAVYKGNKNYNQVTVKFDQQVK